jgi:DnaJ-class molecular chaperone
MRRNEQTKISTGPTNAQLDRALVRNIERMKCPTCKGTGDVGDDSPRGCPECDGTGKRNLNINPL